MTNKEAIEIMSRMKKAYIDTRTESMLKRESSILILEAYDKAIRSLNHQKEVSDADSD